MERSYKDKFEYKILPPTGGSEIIKKGDSAQLLHNIPYLLSSGIVPPLNVLNELLSKGVYDAGMSGGAKWTPYRIKQGEFEALLQELKTNFNFPNLEYVEPDDWVSSFEDWNVWLMYVKHDIPWEEHKRLNDAVVMIERELEAAKNDKNKEKILKLHLKYINKSEKLSDYVLRHMKK